MLTGLDAELDATHRAMEASFHARLISTFDPELVCAPAEAHAKDWLSRNRPDFDQFPVRENGRTIGVVLRDTHADGKTVRDVMLSLRDGLVISTHMPIADLIPQLRENHFRLVLRGHNIDGLVTQSDLVKLPVRMLLFGLISHFELLLRALIRRRHIETAWMEALDKNRQRALKKKLAKLRKRKLEPDPLELTLLSDALQILARARDIGEALTTDSSLLTDFRNDIAHAKTFVSSPDDVRRFVDRFEKLRAWIDRISALLGTTT